MHVCYAPTSRHNGGHLDRCRRALSTGGAGRGNSRGNLPAVQVDAEEHRQRIVAEAFDGSAPERLGEVAGAVKSLYLWVRRQEGRGVSEWSTARKGHRWIQGF